MPDTHPDPRSRREILDALANLWKAARPFTSETTLSPTVTVAQVLALRAALQAAFPEWTCPICKTPQGRTPNAAICDGCQAQNHRTTSGEP